MFTRNWLTHLMVAFAMVAVAGNVRAEDKKDEKKPEAKKDAPAAGGEKKPEAKPADPKAADAKKPEAKKDDKGGHDAGSMASPMGPEHAVLKQMAGNWDFVTKWKMAPTDPWIETKGSSKVEVIFDGRYARQELNGAPMAEGAPAFQGRGVTGYDVNRKQYVNAWIDNHETGIFLSYGTADATGKVITYSGEAPDHANPSKMTKVKSVYKIKDDKTHVFEMYNTGPDGKEYVSLEVTYTKK